MTFQKVTFLIYHKTAARYGKRFSPKELAHNIKK